MIWGVKPAEVTLRRCKEHLWRAAACRIQPSREVLSELLLDLTLEETTYDLPKGVAEETLPSGPGAGSCSRDVPLKLETIPSRKYTPAPASFVCRALSGLFAEESTAWSGQWCSPQVCRAPGEDIGNVHGKHQGRRAGWSCRLTPEHCSAA